MAREFIGPVDPNFGKSVITTRHDPEVSEGWGKRPYNWEYSASVQHELLPRVSLDVGYYRRTFSNQVVTDNLDVTPADFDPFCVTAPTDSRLGTVSGSQVCGLYDITPAKAGIASNQVIRFAKDYYWRDQPDLQRRRCQRERPPDRTLVPPGRGQCRADRHEELRGR